MYVKYFIFFVFFFSSRRRHTRLQGDWSSDVCSSDLKTQDGFSSGLGALSARRKCLSPGLLDLQCPPLISKRQDGSVGRCLSPGLLDLQCPPLISKRQDGSVGRAGG